jgi:hypothetical protein
LIVPGWWRYGVMMTHIGSMGMGSHIVSVFMLIWGWGPFLLVFIDAQNGFFYGFLDKKVCKLSISVKRV